MIQEVDAQRRKNNIPEAMPGDSRRFVMADPFRSAIDLGTQLPTVAQVYDFSFLLYLAQSCHLMTVGGWHAENMRGSGQITQKLPEDMWQATGCAQIFPGFRLRCAC